MAESLWLVSASSTVVFLDSQFDSLSNFKDRHLARASFLQAGKHL